MHAYIEEHGQIFIDECPGYGVQTISRLQSQCENMKFSDQSRYNRMFQKVFTKEGSHQSTILKDFRILRLWKF